jgi:hypothetical protein
MHPNAALIEQFYSCFSKSDFEGMKKCLHPDIRFKDLGFQLHGKEVGAMWHMICDNGIKITYDSIKANDSEGSAHWACDYLFHQKEGSRGSPVHNVVYASFTFQNGLIRHHEDSCDYKKWVRQALGWTGFLVGWLPFMPAVIRAKAREKIDNFIFNKNNPHLQYD